jgi:hypothetical protein
MSAFSALDTLLDQYDGKNTDLLVRISEDWLPSQKLLQHLVSFAETAEGLAQVAATWLLKRYQEAGAQFPEPQASGSRKRPLVHRRPSVSEGSPGWATQIRSDMGDSNSGVVLGSRLLDTDRAANR